MKQPVQVVIQGRTYSLRSEAPVEEIERIAAFVNESIADVTGGGRSIDPHQAAVLALLNVAGAYLQRREQPEPRQDKELEQRLRRLLEKVDKVCPDAGLFD